MQIVLTVAAAFAFLVLMFVVIVALRPSAFLVRRKGTAKAPVNVVFDLVNTLKCWENWSPWAKRDPKMTITYGGPNAGIGATYHWAGNSEVGEGRMTITESAPSRLIRIKLEFMRPFAGTNNVEFAFSTHEEQTTVEWTMQGNYSFIPKALGMFMDMDKMIGGDFEKGLAGLKTLAETPPAEPTRVAS